MIRIPLLTAATLVLLSAWTATTNASEIYHWTDEDGVVHFSDSRPEDGAVVTTLYVQDTNPPDYDPATDPYSIRNQADRTNAMWTELEKAREEREQQRREAAERNARLAAPPYDADRYYSRPAFFPFVHHGIHAVHHVKLARRQLLVLEELGLTGPRPFSINSGAHHARVQRSRNLPAVIRGHGPPRKMP